MWRSNVLRLRSCSSAAIWRATRCYSSRTGLPIKNEEFNAALRYIYKDDRQRTNDGVAKVRKLGFAISGGVDSMALAALYANVKSSQLYTSSAHAFIVDHKVRPESTEEAEWVAEQCRSKFGMEASVLPLSWPVDFDSLDHKRFETDARVLRYQALGRACRAAQIYNLMVAHHADDQAETVLMRLGNKRLRSGLQAMQPVEWIPECFGIHGVSHSGVCYNNYENPRLEHMPFPVESGGVRILRPLLNFDKARLIATCEQHGVAWAEDKTNHIQTYTSRNAIRHVLKNHQLPAALSIKSLVQVSSHMQERVNRHKSEAEYLLGQCRMQLDLRSGALHIRFPPFQQLLRARPSAAKSIDALTQSDFNEAKNNAVYLLARVGHLVAPKESPPLGELAAIVGNIWPEFDELEITKSHQAGFTGNRTNYCIYGIWWRKWETTSVFLKRDSPKGSSALEWLLTRQLPENHRPGVASGYIHYPPSHTISPTPDNTTSDRYQLFDGRWWIKIQNHSVDELILRLLTKEDLARLPPLQQAKQRGPLKFIATALSLTKPVDLRFTLPVVFRRDAVTKEETLVGFPTLNVSLEQLGCPKDVCSWQVRYKKIDLHVDQLATTIVPGITHAVIEKELQKFGKSARDLAARKKATIATGNAAGQNSKQVNRKQALKPISDAYGERLKSVDKDRVQYESDQGISKRGKSISLVPVPESKRHGRSEKREGGGYGIKWKDFKDRFR